MGPEKLFLRPLPPELLSCGPSPCLDKLQTLTSRSQFLEPNIFVGKDSTEVQVFRCKLQKLKELAFWESHTNQLLLQIHGLDLYEAELKCSDTLSISVSLPLQPSLGCSFEASNQGNRLFLSSQMYFSVSALKWAFRVIKTSFSSLWFSSFGVWIVCQSARSYGFTLFRLSLSLSERLIRRQWLRPLCRLVRSFSFDVRQSKSLFADWQRLL